SRPSRQRAIPRGGRPSGARPRSYSRVASKPRARRWRWTAPLSPTDSPMIHIDVHGVAVPALGFGTWLLRGEEALHAVGVALDAGYRHLDTAQAYDNEREVGRALRESGLPREDVFLTTKV